MKKLFILFLFISSIARAFDDCSYFTRGYYFNNQLVFMVTSFPKECSACRLIEMYEGEVVLLRLNDYWFEETIVFHLQRINPYTLIHTIDLSCWRADKVTLVFKVLWTDEYGSHGRVEFIEINHCNIEEVLE